MCSCYTIYKNESGMYIYYKGAKTLILKDDKNVMYFINNKGKKVRLFKAERIEMGNILKKNK